MTLLLEAHADPNATALLPNYHLHTDLSFDPNLFDFMTLALDGTMLMHAAHHHSARHIHALLVASANVNDVAGAGYTALTLLLQSQANASCCPSLKLLIAASADCNAAQPNGDSPLALALQHKSSAVSSLEQKSSDCSQLELQEAFAGTEVMALLNNGARVTQKHIFLAVDRNLHNVTRHLLHCGGSFAETMDYVNSQKKKAHLSACGCTPMQCLCRTARYCIWLRFQSCPDFCPCRRRRRHRALAASVSEVCCCIC